MHNLKQAYEKLGLSSGSSLDDVEKAYEMHLRRTRRVHDPMPISEISEAYRQIKQYEFDQSLSERSKRQGPWAEKLEHFWYHYKFHFIGIVTLLLLIGSLVHSSLEHRREQALLASLPPASLEIMIYGDFYKPNLERLEQSLLHRFPDWQRVRTIFSYYPLKTNDPFAISMRQKSAIDLYMENPDVFITDLGNFERLSTQNAFEPLDHMQEALKAAFGSERLIYEQMNGQLIGVNLTGTVVFENIFVNEDESVVSISNQASHSLQAEQFLRALMLKNKL